MTRQRLVISAVLAGVLVATAASTSAPAAHPDPVDRDLDLVASANASTAEPVASDDAFAYVVAPRRNVKSDVVATGSATCDGCDAASTAVQVLYVSRGREARLDNTATAWTQGCQGCAASAMSVQVVVLRGVPTIVPNNRALAVNAACASCRATGVAFQVVVAARRADRLSWEAVDALRAWVAEQAVALRIPPPDVVPSPEPSSEPAPTAEPEPTAAATPSDDTTLPTTPTARVQRKHAFKRAKRTADAALVTLEELVTGDLGAVPVSADVELRLD